MGPIKYKDDNKNNNTYIYIYAIFQLLVIFGNRIVQIVPTSLNLTFIRHMQTCHNSTGILESVEEIHTCSIYKQ